MSYDYRQERPFVFTEDGQLMLLRVRDKAFELFKIAGAARLDCLIRGLAGDTWSMLACVDRLVEIGDMREITDRTVAGQHRVFVGTHGNY